MRDSIKMLMNAKGLRITFTSINTKTTFLVDMKDKGIEMFTNEIGYDCYVTPYTDKHPTGYFLSNEQRIGLAFTSEKQKFFFKEYLNIQSDQFIDMGRGYEAQMHFNNQIMSGIELKITI